MKAPAHLRPSLGAFLLAFSATVAAQNATTTRPVGLHAGPDGTYPLVAQLEADTPVEVMGCLDDWSWCDVSFEDNRGWLYAPAITYEYEGGYVPLYSYAPGLGIAVVGFSIDDYWGRYYHERPWYAQRADWIRRGPPRHERPPGPLPHAGPPPRPVRADRPREESRPERPLHLGSAEPRHQESDRHHGATEDGDARPPEPRSVEHLSPATPRTEEHANATEHASPAAHDDHTHAAQHAAPATHQERPRPQGHPTRPEHDEHSPSPPK